MYEIFRQLLKAKGLTVADVSKGTGISQSTLSNWKKRNNLLSMKNAALIADFLDVSVDTLMGNTKESVPYYLNEESAQIAQEIFENPELRALFHTVRDVRPEDLKMVADLAERLKRTNPDE